MKSNSALGTTTQLETTNHASAASNNLVSQIRTVTSQPVNTNSTSGTTTLTAKTSQTSATSSNLPFQTTTSGTIQPEAVLNLTSETLIGPVSTDNAANAMDNIGHMLELMGNASTASIKIGQINGVVAKLPQQNQRNKNFAFTSRGDSKILTESNNLAKDYALTVHLPKEASEMAVKRNASYIGILLFPGIPQISATSFLFNNQIVGIEMGVNISNLSETIDINFKNVTKTGFSVSCVSWDGRSKRDGADNWITDGCKTKEADGSVLCQCSHLTFFAILMTSSGTRNISSSDLKTLTQITKAGCGMSLFFLGVALFMHFLMRKNKANQAVNVLMNLFIALFSLNLCFLINESITDLKIFAACVAIAAALHYSMLATFTWFFMQALHLYFNLYKIRTDIKYYLCKICITGWVIPALVVVGLLASNKYGDMEISDDSGTSVNMCWIPDYSLHLGVNTGYYGIVFIFTLTIFIVTVVHITHFASETKKNKISTKKRVFSLLGLFSLLGITWGFAFFSYGPLLLPSYYIFTILNSFQGFFLFIYYYFSSRINPQDKNQPESSSHTTENVYITNPYK
ncbi:adhesion G-protein coupled receptor G2-like [Fundulus diaphanus]